MDDFFSYRNDLEKLNAKFVALDAIITFDDGTKGIDPDKVPGNLLNIYNNLISYGYAKGYNN